MHSFPSHVRYSLCLPRVCVYGALGVLLFFLGSPPASAQLQTGNLYGTVIDEQGNPLPGVTLTLTGFVAPQVGITNTQGQFRFLSLAPGPYQLRAELEGFESITYPNIVISLSRNTEVEVTLSSTVEDVIMVTSETPLLDERRIDTDPKGEKKKGRPGAGGQGRGDIDISVVDTGQPGAITDTVPSKPPIHTPSGERTEAAKNYTEVEVFYGTDRFATGSKIPDFAFGSERSRAKSLHLGVCRVSVPRSHQSGIIDEPAVWRLEFRPDPSKHMVLIGREALSAGGFFKRMQGTLNKSGRKELLVFVHGFNVSFKDAVLRTAQLATDLRIDGVPVVYSWPSEASLMKYWVDSNNAEWTIQHLEPFLRDLSLKSGASSIYLVAHSMGNRPLTRALERIALQLKSFPAKPPFSQILLTAPDIDAEVFADLARSFHRIGDRVTLYASSQDVALNVSNWVNKYPRAGEAGNEMLVAPNVDIVDVSSVDSRLKGFGHSYFADNCTVLSDIYRLLRDRVPPKLRGLNQVQNGGVAYWAIQAAVACPASK